MILRTCELLVLLLHNFTYSVLLVLHVVGRGGAIALLYPPRHLQKLLVTLKIKIKNNSIYNNYSDQNSSKNRNSNSSQYI